MRALRSAVTAALLLFTGCASYGYWGQFYHAAPHRPRFEKTDSVEIRFAPAERLAAFWKDEHQREVRSNRSPADRSVEEKTETRGRLLDAVQLSDDPHHIVVVGETTFWSAGPADAYDGKLEAFAKSIGATYAVVLISDGGTHRDIVPFRTSSFSSGYGIGTDAYGNVVSGNAFGSTYSTVPVAVDRQHTVYDVIFFRKTP